MLNELESKFTELQAEHIRTVEASMTWRSKLEEEQQRTHLTLTESEMQAQQIHQQLNASLNTINQLSEEVNAKNVMIGTLQQRVQDLLTELSTLGEFLLHISGTLARTKAC